MKRNVLILQNQSLGVRRTPPYLSLIVLSLTGVLILSGCTLDAEMFNSSKYHNRVDPDLLDGEAFHAKNGVEFRGSFKEISNKVQLPNGVVFEGAFYD